MPKTREEKIKDTFDNHKSLKPKPKNEYEDKIKTFTLPLDKLHYEFDNGSESVKNIINNILFDQVSNNVIFANKYLNDKKDCKKMYKCILDFSKQFLDSKNGYISPATIYSLALHYFEETKPEYVKEMFTGNNIEFGIKDNDFVIREYIVKEVEKEIITEVKKEITIEKIVEKEILSKEKLEILRTEIRNELMNGKPKKEIKAEKVQKQLDIFSVMDEK